MPWWGALIGAGVSMLSEEEGGGAGGGGAGQQQTMSKEPWAAAAPWLKQNIQTGQDLQGYYQRNPFNQQQQNAYGNLSAGTGYVNQLVPSLLSQIGNQPGFDRTNPRAKPAGINFNVPGGGLLGSGGQGGGQRPDMNVANNPFANGGIQAPQQQMAPQQAPQQSMDGSGDLGYLNWRYVNQQSRPNAGIFGAAGQQVPEMPGLDYKTYQTQFVPQIREGF